MKNYSIAIFGSSLREDFDKYSDKDLLIVADSYKKLKKLEKKYSGQEWSISFYTYSKLRYLANSGSLFVNHLKKESKIFSDDNTQLSQILSSYIPKKNYLKELKESKEFFEILKYIPNNKTGFAWFCDTLFVGLRNYLVFKNAEDKVFEFSFNKLLERLKEENRLNEDEVITLRELRVIKRNYREDVSEEFPSYDFMEKVVTIIEKLELIDKVEIIDSSKFQNTVEETIYDINFSPYQKLRLIEAFYNAQNKNIAEIKKVICNPQFYAMKFKDQNYISNLLSIIKKRHITSVIVNSVHSSEK